MLGVKILEERSSKFNGQIKVINAWGWGTYIQADGLTQSGGIIESMWKATLKKLRREKIKNCLVLGLGGGTVVKVIQKYWPHAKITGVDIDPIMIRLGEKYLGLNKDLITIKLGDAANFTGKKYDMVIVDLYNGDKFPLKFESDAFLKSLAKNKIVIFNRLYFNKKKTESLKFGRKLEKIFKDVNPFRPAVNIMFFCEN